MQRTYMKPALSVLWILTVIVAALTSDLSSTSNWIVVAVIAAVPPAVAWQLWSAPAPSMSENIRRAKD